MNNEGIDVGICTQQDRVIINFGAHIDWVQMSRADALAFAELVKEQAMQIEVGETD